MAGIRNRLVHLSDDVDDALVARPADEDVEDWSAFARVVAGLIDADGSQGRT